MVGLLIEVVFWFSLECFLHIISEEKVLSNQKEMEFCFYSVRERKDFKFEQTS